ncbi:MAG: MBL fold metallo-hydrolase [Longimicrobiales bacterium]
MKLRFLGTRGEIEPRTAAHAMHTSLEIGYRGRRVMIDAGQDWRGRLDELRPQAIVITHAHPDHAWGLKDGAPCAVWAPREVWRALERYPIRDRHTIEPRTRFHARGIEFEAFPVEHSIRAPAVGYRISAGRVTIFYAPDLVYIQDRADALRGVDVYVGDGATLERSFVRRRGERLLGHAPVRTQLGWCAKEGVPRAVITHCGSEIVTGDPAEIDARLQALASERGVQAEIAVDGFELVLRSQARSWRGNLDRDRGLSFPMSSRLTIERRVLSDLLAHAREAHPAEACGSLLGRSAGASRATVRAVSSLRATNAAADDQSGFLIEAAELRAIEYRAAAAGLELVGFYHSHPHGDARPSMTDLELAIPGWAYLIVARAGTPTPLLRAWRLRADRTRFERMALRGARLPLHRMRPAPAAP